MDEESCRARLASGRVGHLATVRPDGRPHVVVCCFALDGDRLWTAVDAKPKATTRLQRLANVRAHPWASLLVDHYEEDWDRLWWVRVDGAAAVLEEGAERERAVAALVAKYAQYASAPPEGPVVALAVERWRGWAAS
jgi:PPOX class probable F420-dependent enzyme